MDNEGSRNVLQPTDNENSRVRRLRVWRRRYATSNDARGYLSVNEMNVCGQTILWDYRTGMVHLTGLCKAVGLQKANVVRFLDSNPGLHAAVRRIKGGVLKIQGEWRNSGGDGLMIGTWVAHEIALVLARRVCFPIREALTPLFGASFPTECLRPGSPGYGTLEVRLHKHQRRSVRVVQEGEEKEKEEHHHPPDLAPPPLPSEILISECERSDLLRLLQATRSLQLLSTGQSRGWVPGISMGGHFACNGRRWMVSLPCGASEC